MTRPRRPAKKHPQAISPAIAVRGRKPATKHAPLPHDYAAVLADVKQLIAQSRRRALATVNRELVGLYWKLGRVIVQQQEIANWGDAVVEQLAADLRAAFPDMSGLSVANLWRTRQFFLSCRETEAWLSRATASPPKAQELATLLRELPAMPSQPAGDVKAANWSKVATLCQDLSGVAAADEKLAALLRELAAHLAWSKSPASSPELPAGKTAAPEPAPVSAEFQSLALAHLIPAISWSQHTITMGACDRPDERCFYMAMSARERWSVRELRRQIDSALFLRYMSVKRDPDKCLPDDAESGDLLPFKDHYILGLEDEHTERELRQAILANLRQFFLEFGRDLTLVGEEYPLTIGGDTFRIDVLFFHRRLQCLIAVDLKIGEFLPEFVGKSLFYVTALDEQVRLPHENPSIGLILCRGANQIQVRIALTPAAKKIGVATYQTALPDERLIRARLEHLAWPRDDADE